MDNEFLKKLEEYNKYMEKKLLEISSVPKSLLETNSDNEYKASKSMFYEHEYTTRHHR